MIRLDSVSRANKSVSVSLKHTFTQVTSLGLFPTFTLKYTADADAKETHTPHTTCQKGANNESLVLYCVILTALVQL